MTSGSGSSTTPSILVRSLVPSLNVKKQVFCEFILRENKISKKNKNTVFNPGFVP